MKIESTSCESQLRIDVLYFCMPTATLYNFAFLNNWFVVILDLKLRSTLKATCLLYFTFYYYTYFQFKARLRVSDLCVGS